MSGLLSTISTFNHAKAPSTPIWLESDDTAEREFVPEPGRGIALGVFLSVPLWFLLAWAVYFLATAV